LINSIIPSDPLRYDAAGLLGQDPTLARMKKFKDDSDKDFSVKVKNRIRGAAPEPITFDKNNAPPPQNQELQAAEEWLKANPSDPRAGAMRHKIMKLKSQDNMIAGGL